MCSTPKGGAVSIGYRQLTTIDGITRHRSFLYPLWTNSSA